MAPARHHEHRVEDDPDPDGEQLQAVIDRYERLLQRRARLRREADADEEFVWTTDCDRN